MDPIPIAEKPMTPKKIIKDKDRKKAGASVPAQGLYLMNVEYPKNSFSEKNI